MDNNYIAVLDHGFVGLVDVMGDDASIVQAARVSYGKGTKTVNEDRGLIRYLMRHSHTTPFEMVEFKFHVACPISIARQWLRHRTASVNEYSLRYSVAPKATYLPPVERFVTQDVFNRQASGMDPLEDAAYRRSITRWDLEYARDRYEGLINAGLNRETARGVLPMNQYTEFYWKIDLHNLLHFIRLRADSHAQPEIQDFARSLGHFVKDTVPLAWEAFLDYNWNGAKLSHQQIRQLAGDAGDLTPREQKELDAILNRDFTDPALVPDQTISPEQAHRRLHG